MLENTSHFKNVETAMFVMWSPKRTVTFLVRAFVLVLIHSSKKRAREGTVSLLHKILTACHNHRNKLGLLFFAKSVRGPVVIMS